MIAETTPHCTIRCKVGNMAVRANDLAPLNIFTLEFTVKLTLKKLTFKSKQNKTEKNTLEIETPP